MERPGTVRLWSADRRGRGGGWQGEQALRARAFPGPCLWPSPAASHVRCVWEGKGLQRDGILVKNGFPKCDNRGSKGAQVEHGVKSVHVTEQPLSVLTGARQMLVRTGL